MILDKDEAARDAKSACDSFGIASPNVEIASASLVRANAEKDRCRARLFEAIDVLAGIPCENCSEDSRK